MQLRNMPRKRARQPADSDNSPENHCATGSTTPQRKSPRLQDEQPSTSDMGQRERLHSEGSDVADPKPAARRDERSEPEEDQDETEELEAASTTETPENHCATGSTTPQRKSPRLQDEQPSTSDMDQRERRHSEGSDVADLEPAAGRGERSEPEEDRDETEELQGASTTETPGRHSRTFLERLSDAVQGRDYFDLQRIEAEKQISCTLRSGIINEGVPAEWNDAVFAIMDFACDLAYRRPGSWNDLEPRLREELLDWTPQAQELLGDPQRAAYLYAARIWRTLDEQVLSAGAETSREFLGPAWSRFAEMKDALKTTGHDKPWKRSNMEAAYHMWKWYTAVMTHYSFCAFPEDKLTDVATRRVIRDLVPLVGASADEAETWAPKIKNFCFGIALIVRSLTLTHSKTWVAWKPEGHGGGQSGFPVSSVTDEGCNVMMAPWSCMPWLPPDDPRDLNGSKVHLVVSPALVASYVFTGDFTHHYMAPMTVIVDGHLRQGGPEAEGGP